MTNQTSISRFGYYLHWWGLHNLESRKGGDLRFNAMSDKGGTEVAN